MPNINDAFPSKYLKGSDLKGAEPVVTIDRVDFEPVGREREMKAVIYFAGKEKGLVLNKTNATKITQIAGSPQTEDWSGIRLKLYVAEQEFGGETYEVVRVKNAPAQGAARPAAPAPPPVAAEGELTDDEIPF